MLRRALCAINAGFEIHFGIQKAQILWDFSRTLRLFGNVELTSTGFGERTLSDFKWASKFTNKRRDERREQAMSLVTHHLAV